MGIWHNVRIDVSGTGLSEADLYEACDRAPLRDVFVRKGKHGLVAEAQGPTAKPEELAKSITDEVQKKFTGGVIVRVYKNAAERVWERNVLGDGRIVIDE